ncbi:MAG: PDGLE domain-containing protein, partial [Oscillospiraceae bacterium]
PFGTFLAVMMPIHLAIGLVEGLVTAAVLLFVYEARPEMLKDAPTEAVGESKFSLKTTLAVFAVMVLAVGGGFSLLASSNPDGLEWSMFGNAEAGYNENMGLSEEEFGVSSKAADVAAGIQEKTAFLPDYAFASDADNPAGTSTSGIVGAAIVATLAIGICFVGGLFRKSKKKQSEKTV